YKGTRKVIVFVHGVLGDMDNSWAGPNGSPSWPELVATDTKFSDYDVYVYGYQSPCEGGASDINQIATRLERSIEDQNFFSVYDEIDFITHSMGGLITKRMLILLNTPQNAEKLWRVRTVLLISVPSMGAPLAKIAHAVSSNPQFRDMDPDTSEALLRQWDEDWDSLMTSRTQKRPYPRAFVAYETKTVEGIEVLPDVFRQRASDQRPIAFDENHIDIVKPDSIDNEVYVWAKARILHPLGDDGGGGGDKNPGGGNKKDEVKNLPTVQAEEGFPFSTSIPQAGGPERKADFMGRGCGWLSFRDPVLEGTPPSSKGPRTCDVRISEIGRADSLYSLTIEIARPIAIETNSLPSGVPTGDAPCSVQQTWSARVVASGGWAPYSWSVPNKPSWLKWDPGGTTLALSGSPPTAGNYSNRSEGYRP
ncbi:MAG: alpha/beta hydrolase, partial [Candidatus Eremiobacteraeota bacterium]|nr:alpha/beta hydrolase [Candidatus Eremiobacteraeota bacterium]